MKRWLLSILAASALHAGVAFADESLAKRVASADGWVLRLLRCSDPGHFAFAFAGTAGAEEVTALHARRRCGVELVQGALFGGLGGDGGKHSAHQLRHSAAVFPGDPLPEPPEEFWTSFIGSREIP